MAGEVDAFLDAMAPALPVREARAIRLALGCMASYQIPWILDFGGASILVKSRRIGGSFAYAFACALWALFGEETSVVSVGERESLKFLLEVERHCRWLAGLGSRWARPLRARYRVDLVLRLASGGIVTALPASNAARGMGGNVCLDEAGFHQNPEAVWEASAAATLHGGKLRVLSTPAGIGGLFYELATTPNPDFRRFSTTLTEARAAGLRISDKKIRQIDRGNPGLHAALFECSFQARGGSLFTDIHHYDALPRSYRIAIGVDFAYSLAEAADYSVAVTVAESGGRFYVLDCVRKVTKDFTPELRVLKTSRPGVKMHWYCGTSERLFGDQVRRSGFPLVMHEIKRGQDKYARALNTAGLWNTGNLMVPERAPWLADFVAEVSTFTGAKCSTGQHDDIVDALVAAVEALRADSGAVGITDEDIRMARTGQSDRFASVRAGGDGWDDDRPGRPVENVLNQGPPRIAGARW